MLRWGDDGRDAVWAVLPLRARPRAGGQLQFRELAIRICMLIIIKIMATIVHEPESCWRSLQRTVIDMRLLDGEILVALFGATNGYKKNGRISCNVQIPLKATQ